MSLAVMLPRLALAATLFAPIVELDHDIRDAVQASRDPAYEGVMKAASDIGKPVVVFGTLLAIAVFTGPAGVQTAREALYVLLPTNIAVEVLKRSTNRTRPDGTQKRSNAAFPSSHAANAAALAAVFSARWGRLRLPLWLGALTVAWSRVYLNRHFLSDVVVGVAIGVLCAWWVGRRMRPRRGSGVPSRFSRWASRSVEGSRRL
jgi:undecaprenyl-diphosphatase